MFLLDISGTIFGAIHIELGNGVVPTSDSLKHIVVNCIRSYNVNFRREFGEMVICCDSSSWRKEKFPLYKFMRKKEREKEDGEMWKEIFENVEKVISDIKTYFPYKVIRVDRAEADDIIGAIVLDHCKKSKEKILIVSNDKDFGGLQRHKQVKQWRPMIATRKNDFDAGWLTIDDPDFFEYDLVMTGDSSDGIPNVKSDDDFYKNKYETELSGKKAKRAASITKKWKAETFPLFMHDMEAFQKKLTKAEFKNFKRNVLLISLAHIPEEIKKAVMVEFESVVTGNIQKTLDHLFDSDMNIMAKSIKDFELGKSKSNNSKVLEAVFG